MGKIIAVFLSLAVTFLGIPQTDPAIAATPACNSIGINTLISYYKNGQKYDLTGNDATIPEGTQAIAFQVSGPLTEGATYQIDFSKGVTGQLPVRNGQIPPFFTANPELLKKRSYQGVLKQQNSTGGYTPYCTGIDYRVGAKYDFKDCRLTLSQTPVINQTIVANISTAPPNDPGENYKIVYFTNKEFIDQNKRNDKEVVVDQYGNGAFVFTTNSIPKSNVGIYLRYTYPPLSQLPPEIFCRTEFNVEPATQPPTTPICTISPATPTPLTDVFVQVNNLVTGELYRADLTNKATNININLPTRTPADSNGLVKLQLNQPPQYLPAGTYSAQVYDVNANQLVCTTTDFSVGSVSFPSPVAKPCTDPKRCTSIGDVACKNEKRPSVKTAIGCIHTNPGDLIVDVLKFGVGIGGGLAFLMMLLGAFQMLTSAGNPETLQAGKDRLTSAIIGLLVIIFSVLLLQIIGVDILGILKR